MSFSLAHLSDLHLPTPGEGIFRQRINVKQFLAVLSWRRKRHRMHTLQPMSALLADLGSYAPDHIALTGDLVNFAIPAEFSAAREWLERRGSPLDLSVIPGNHDLTARVSWQDGLGQWSAWMDADAPGPERFPFLRRRGPLALIGLSSAVTTPVFSAAGALGRPQLERLESLLAETAQAGLFRVVLIHHPPLMIRGGPRKALRDRAALRSVLKRRGAELVLHGHHHVTSLARLAGPNGAIPLIGVPAMLGTTTTPEIAGWHLHRILRTEAGWRLTTLARRYDPASDSFRQAGEWTVDLPCGRQHLACPAPICDKPGDDEHGMP